jgi:hypothetical protein
MVWSGRGGRAAGARRRVRAALAQGSARPLPQRCRPAAAASHDRVFVVPRVPGQVREG